MLAFARQLHGFVLHRGHNGLFHEEVNVRRLAAGKLEEIGALHKVARVNTVGWVYRKHFEEDRDEVKAVRPFCAHDELLQLGVKVGRVRIVQSGDHIGEGGLKEG